MMMRLPFRGPRGPRPTIAGILRGCTPGRMQSVGIMQVLPLLSDLEDERIVPPCETVVATTGYGTLRFDNPTGRLVLVPSHAGYVVDAPVQDHAMPSATFVPPRKARDYRRAMCVQETQGGLMRAGRHDLVILPLTLRRPALAMRNKDEYSRLWTDIQRFNRRGGLATPGNLVDFIKHYRAELDQFVAEFEIVPRQVGAVVLVAGEVVGIERAPSHAYWAAVWEPLIRTCYGAYAVTVARGSAAAPDTRVPLDAAKAASLDDLADALEETERAEDAAARAKIRELLDEPFTCERDERRGTFEIETVRNAQFLGQIVREGERVLYASLVVDASWADDRGWHGARPFAV